MTVSKNSVSIQTVFCKGRMVGAYTFLVNPKSKHELQEFMPVIEVLPFAQVQGCFCIASSFTLAFKFSFVCHV